MDVPSAVLVLCWQVSAVAHKPPPVYIGKTSCDIPSVSNSCMAIGTQGLYLMHAGTELERCY